jgi:PBP1b-binding outer membrane lipoprotein LpoB
MTPMRSSLLALLAASAMAPVACNQGARVVTDDRDKIVSVDQLDVQDWSNAADQVVQQMLASGVLANAPTTPARVEVTRVVNDTTQRVDTDLLTQKVKIALQQSGKVAFASTDSRAGEVADYRDFKDGKDKPRLPDYVLNGKIIEIRASAGRTKQSSYVFQLNLVDTRQDIDAWSGEAEVTKKGSKNATSSKG